MAVSKRVRHTVLGKVYTHTIRFPKFKVDQDRTIRVWVPNTYDSNSSEPYKVMYFLDGQNLFDSATSSYGMEWCIDETMLYHEKNYQSRPYIVVGLDCSSNRMSEYLPKFVDDTSYEKFNENKCEKYVELIDRLEETRKTKDGLEQLGDDTIEYLLDYVMPFIEETYNVRTDRDGRTFGGSSMGGLMSIYTYQHHNEYFKNYVMYSVAFNVLHDITGADEYFDKFLSELKYYPDTKICMCCGGVDYEKEFQPYFYQLKEKFTELGFDKINFKTTLAPKEKHNEVQWAKAFNSDLKFFNE